MSNSTGHGSGHGMSLPGQPTEEALAEVGSEAGKSIVRGIAKLGNASVSEYTATKEAKAEAARLAIQTEAQIASEAALIDARRNREVQELEHQAALYRRAERLRYEFAREQRNLEAIERRALDFTETDPENHKSQELDEDWLFRFADLAQKVSDNDVQNLWARVRSSAAIEEKHRLSAAALQTLSLFDKGIAENLRKFTAVIVRFGFFPHATRGRIEPQDTDLASLQDLGLIQEVTNEQPYSFEDFAFQGNKTPNLGLDYMTAHLSFTKRGAEIANAVFHREEEAPLSAEHEQKYLQNILAARTEQFGAIIIPKLENGGRVAIRVTAKSGAEMADWTSSPIAAQIGPRLKALLMWASANYDVEIESW